VSELGVVPKGWQTKCLKDVAEVHYGKSPASVKDDENGSYPIVGTGGQTGKARTFLCDKPAVVVGRKGTIDKPQLLKEPFWPIDTTFYCIPKNDSETVWLYELLKASHLETLNESTGLPSLSRENLYALQLLVPPVEEQRKIADILSAWDEAIEQQTRLLELKRERKRGLMQQLLTGKVRFKEFEGLEWSKGQVVDFFELQRGYDLPVNQRGYGNVPIIASNGLTGFHNEARVKGPGVITGRSGTIGKVIFETSDFWPLNTSLYVKNFRGNDPKFVFYFLTNLQLERFSNGTGVPTLNRNDVHPVETRFPSLDEQQKIATVLSAADAELQTLETQLLALRTQKRGLMQQLLTGKTRVKATQEGAAD
jgi:type I restriction enzyme S subunit